jgi:hypothetical protein
MKPGYRRKWKVPLLVWVLVPAAFLLLAGANAHLVYVAFLSQPECVAHLKVPGPGAGQFRAAKSDC